MRPKSIVTFERVVLAMIGLMLLSTLLMLSLFEAIARMSGTSTGLLLAIPLLMILIYGVLVWFVARQAAVVAKWIYVVITGLSLLWGLVTIGTLTAYPAHLAILNLLQYGLMGFSLFLLFQADANAWFAQGGSAGSHGGGQGGWQAPPPVGGAWQPPAPAPQTGGWPQPQPPAQPQVPQSGGWPQPQQPPPPQSAWPQQQAAPQQPQQSGSWPSQPSQQPAPQAGGWPPQPSSPPAPQPAGWPPQPSAQPAEPAPAEPPAVEAPPSPPEPASPPATEAAPAYRECPFCAEEIRAQAIKCKHCGSEVEPLVPRD
jgi:hypothetical protein